MDLHVTGCPDSPGGEQFVDVEYTGPFTDGEYDDAFVVSVDAHDGDPPKVCVFEPGDPTDAMAEFWLGSDLTVTRGRGSRDSTDPPISVGVTRRDDAPDGVDWVEITADGYVIVTVTVIVGDAPSVNLFAPGDHGECYAVYQFDEDGSLRWDVVDV